MSSPVSTTNTAPENRAPFLTTNRPNHRREQITRSQLRRSEEALCLLLTVRNDLRAGKIHVERLMEAIMLGVTVAEITLNTSLEQLRQQKRAGGKGTRKGMRQVSAGDVVKTSGTEGRL